MNAELGGLQQFEVAENMVVETDIYSDIDLALVGKWCRQ